MNSGRRINSGGGTGLGKKEVMPAKLLYMQALLASTLATRNIEDLLVSGISGRRRGKILECPSLKF